MRFLKNSHFNIGGYEVSLFEIENIILTNNIRKRIETDDTSFRGSDVRNKLIIEEYHYLINFGMSLPTK